MLQLIHLALLITIIGGCVYSFCQVIILALDALQQYRGNETALWRRVVSIAIQALIYLVLLLIDIQFVRMFHLD